MISPRTGRRAPARDGARGFAVLALAFGLTAAPLVAPVPASADTDEVDTEGVVEIALTVGVHGMVRPDTPLSATVSIDNGTDAPLPAGVVAVELNRTPLADADALTAWLDTEQAEGAFTVLGSEEADSTAATETSSTSISAPTSALGALTPGVYPIRGTFTADDEEEATPDEPASDDPAADEITATSVLIVAEDSDREFTVLVPITATPADGALLTADELDALTAPDGALTAQLDGVAGTSAALAVDPLIPAAIRALGSAAPETAQGWLTRLESLSNERFTLQPGDADATVQARAGLPALLEPLELTPLLDPANFAEATPTPTPTPTATPDDAAEPELPDDAELTEIRGAETGILWPVGDVTAEDLGTFDAYLDTDAVTVLPSTVLSAASRAHVEVAGHDVLATDAAVSATLSSAVAQPDDGARERDIAAAIAQLSFTDATSTLIGLDRDENRTSDALRESILSLSAIGDPTPLSELRESSAASASLAGDDPATDRAGVLDDLLADEKRLTAFASILDDPQVLLSPERIAIMRVIGVGLADSLPQLTAAHRAQTTDTLGSVGVQQPSPIQLFTAAAPLPVWVRNDLPWPVNVTLISQPSDARLDVQPTTPVVAQPASNARVKVPVEARVGSGTLDVDFALVSPTGVPIGDEQTASVTVRAEWEGIGLGILGGLIGLLLVLGIVRTIVRRRKGRDATGEPSASN